MEVKVLGVVACVVESAARLHVSVHVLCPDFEEQTVRVRVQQLTFIAVLHFQVVVVEVVHQRLAEVQDAHARVHWFHHLDLLLVHLDGR